MSLSRRAFLRGLAGAAAVGSAAALSAACSAAAPAAAPTVAATVAPTAVPPTPVPPTPVPPTAPPTTAPTVAPTAESALKVGVLLPYNESSIGVDIGLNQKRAADLYLKQQGGKLGGRSVNLVYSSESVEAGINKVKVNTLLQTEKSALLMGGASDDAARVLRDAAEAAKLVYIDTNGTANGLTRTRSQYVFRTSASSWQLSEPLGEWAAKNGGSEFFVCYVDDVFGSESADSFVAGLSKNRGTATERQALPGGGDWAKAVGAVSAQPVKNVFAAFHTDDAEGFLGEWDKQGMNDAGYKLFGPGLLTEQEVLDQTKNAAEGAVTAHFWSSELDVPENKTLVDAFPKEYVDADTNLPVQLTGYAVAMWDAMAALDSALKQTGAFDTSALIAALEKVSLKSPRGGFAFDANHNPVQDIVIRQVKQVNGRLINAIIEKFVHVADPGT